MSAAAVVAIESATVAETVLMVRRHFLSSAFVVTLKAFVPLWTWRLWTPKRVRFLLSFLMFWYYCCYFEFASTFFLPRTPQRSDLICSNFVEAMLVTVSHCLGH